MTSNDRDAFCNGSSDSGIGNDPSFQLRFSDTAWGEDTGLQWSVNIPKGATIKEAHISIYVVTHWLENGEPAPFEAQIAVEESDNPKAFTGKPDDISCGTKRKYWNKTVRWQIPASGFAHDSWQRSPDIAVLIQHMVNRPKWSPGHVISLSIQGVQGSHGAAVVLADYANDPSKAAKLHVE